MKIDFEGRTWQLDQMDAGMRQSLVITGYTGLSMAGWEKACIDPDDPKWLQSIACLYWLMLEQNGQELDFDAMPDFAPLRFYLALAAATAAEHGPEAEPEDPTKPGDGNAAETLPPSPVSPAGS